ncbi:16S rRNA (guanine(966)-N(2))-methyltransferase RsmD [Leptolyngbya sp. AN02str]|uniref:16S rRNA (guanine(966)-N(2))-methyltransferase RsmD n=1 Tax=Leptolyngbya sp. AN02str TaxID=3423363 RepID=UPI003D31799E
MSLRIYGNRPLKTLSGQDTRPTPARVREALFNIWQGEVDGCRWLDLCSGSGSMAAEALCRGATLVVGIEQSPRACAIIRDNWSQVATPDQAFRLVRGNVLQKLPTLVGQTFDRIYVDPPYASDLYEPIVKAIAQYNLLAPDGELSLEHATNRWRPQEFSTLVAAAAPLELIRQKTYGNISLAFFAHR